MAVDDLWTKKGSDGQKIPSARHGRGKRWRVRNDGARTELFDKKSDAERRDAVVRAELLRGEYIDPQAGRTLVEDYGEKWRADLMLRPQSRVWMERALRLHVYPVLGKKGVGEVKRSNIQGWVRDRCEVLAPQTVKLIYQIVLVPMFKAAEIDRDRGPSPCVGIKWPDMPDREYTIATPEQVWALHDSIAKPYRPVPLLVAGCGHRAGEVFGLEVGDVEFLRRAIRVERQAMKLTKEPVHLAPPKTKGSVRTVELPRLVAEPLARHLELFPPEALDVEDRTDPRKPRTRKAKLVFTDQHGEPMTSREWSDIWRPAVKAAGLPQGYGLRDLRHYFATVLIYGGANVKTVQLAMGHSTPTVTLNTYLGYWPDMLDQTRSLVDEALARPASGSSSASS